MSWTSGGAGSFEAALWGTGEYMHRFRYASRCSDPNLWPLFSDCSIFSLKAEARSWAENEDVCGGVRDLKGEEKVWNSCLGNQQHKWTRIILCDFLATLSAHLRFMDSNLKGECTVFHFSVFFFPQQRSIPRIKERGKSYWHWQAGCKQGAANRWRNDLRSYSKGLRALWKDQTMLCWNRSKGRQN